EEAMQKIEAKIDKEVEKAAKKFGKSFDKEMFLKTNPNVLRNKQKVDEIEARFKEALEVNNLDEVKQIIIDLEIVCPMSGTRNWTDVRQYNLMCPTQVGSVAVEADTLYVRPETAQAIFVNFLNVHKAARQQIPY